MLCATPNRSKHTAKSERCHVYICDWLCISLWLLVSLPFSTLSYKYNIDSSFQFVKAAEFSINYVAGEGGSGMY